MSFEASASTRATTRWLTRIIPLALAGCVGLTTHVVIKRVCLDYFLANGRSATAIPLLALHLLFAVFMIATYLRVYMAIRFNPDITPLGPRAVAAREQEKQANRANNRRGQNGKEVTDIEAQTNAGMAGSDLDSPGLEMFYSKNLFVCDFDGRPKWCSSCCNWKPDRTYHNREINRCVRKLDHYCPWVGGVVSQSSYNFFIQFNFYTALYCTVTLCATVTALRAELGDSWNADGLVVAVIFIAGFFGFFTFSMTMTSLRFTFFNLTSVESVKQQSSATMLAMRVPRETRSGANYGLVTYPIPKQGSGGDFSESHLSDQTTVNKGESRDQSQTWHQTRAQGHSPSPSPPPPPPQTSRDLLACRTFAIVRANVGMNLWDLGPYRNFKAVMGNNPVSWLFPIWHSPCTKDESNESFYEMGQASARLRQSRGLPAMDSKIDGLAGAAAMEMRQLQRG